MVMPAENQLLFNLNPAIRPPPLPTKFRAPQPIVINKFDAVSNFLSFAAIYHAFSMENK